MTLHSEQDAIKQAEDAGYISTIEPCELDGIPLYHTLDTLIDPAFWIALGKARGWFTGEWQPNSDKSPHGCNHYAFEWFQTRLSKGDMKAYWESLP